MSHYNGFITNMKIKSAWFVLPVILFLTPIFAAYFFNEHILSANAPKSLKTVVEVFFPPRDLFDVLVKIPVYPENGNIRRTISFEHKYSGRHQIGVMLEEFESSLYSDHSTIAFRAEITCRLGSDLIMHKEADDITPFLSAQGGGYTIITYDVPSELPKTVDISCDMSLSSLNDVVFDKNGPALLFVRRMSNI